MAEFKVEDYFAGSGGAANDSTDCTAAIQAAFDALYTAGRNGTIVFPSGVCRMNGDVTKNISQGGSLQGTCIIRGNGDSALRIMGTGFQRFNVDGSDLILCEKMNFLGDTSAPGTIQEASNAHFRFSADRVKIRDCNFYGLGVSGTTGCVLRLLGSDHVMVENCGFRGVNGGNNPVIISDGQSWFNTFKNLTFIDYGAYYPTGYSKGGSGSRNWIKVDNVSSQKADRGCVLVEDCFFDEGAQNCAVEIANVRWAEFNRVGINVSGAGTGPKITNVNQLKISSCFWGYTQQPNTVGLRLTDVGETEINGLRFFLGDAPVTDGVDRIEVLGTSGRLKARNLTRGYSTGIENGQVVIVNTAGAELDIDGVHTKGTATEIG